jgi:hypothetical protein
LNTLNPAPVTGPWGELLLTNNYSYVSPVKDSGETKSKRLIITYDNCDVCTGSGSIYWRGSDTLFNKNDVLPAWTLYIGPYAQTNYRYLQIRTQV